ncbi:hypothetical protein ACHAW5_000952 [Stephanodiscus triporus]|uniref:phosphoglycerate mutase (2,3-diphosphoglycerate-dependent) n=1 Tax=Stephanodiscus triporus TaxID=2934178 RepID=A0ABD3N6P0_9STRA
MSSLRPRSSTSTRLLLPRRYYGIAPAPPSRGSSSSSFVVLLLHLLRSSTMATLLLLLLLLLPLHPLVAAFSPPPPPSSFSSISRRSSSSPPSSSSSCNRISSSSFSSTTTSSSDEGNTIEHYSNSLLSTTRSSSSSPRRRRRRRLLLSSPFSELRSRATRRRRTEEERRAIVDESTRYAIVDDDAQAKTTTSSSSSTSTSSPSSSGWASSSSSLCRRALRSIRRASSSLLGGAASSFASAVVGGMMGGVGVGVGGGARTRTRSRPGSLMLLRCGESEWTRSGRFTGWADPDLVPEGILEIEHAGRLLLSEGYEPDVIYTSRLRRAVKSTWTVLNALNSPYLPVYKSWRLNERNYGALTGLRKTDAARTLGVGTVQAWRNSLRARPPPMGRDDPYYPGNDRRYEDLSEGQIPLTESLLDCMARARPLWEYGIREEIRRGNNVLVVAHTNTLRGLMKVIDDIGEEDIKEVSMPGGIPFVYKFDNDMNPVPPPAGKISQAHTSGIFLEKPGLLKEALRRELEYSNVVPGSYGQMTTSTNNVVQRVTTLEKSLLKLKEEQAAAAAAAAAVGRHSNHHRAMIANNPNDDGKLIVTTAMGDPSAPLEEEVDSEFEEFNDRDAPEAEDAVLAFNVQKADEASPGIIKQGGSKDPVVVFIRHGRTPHNNLGLFTGWEDPPLAPDGVEDAKNAGRLLKMHGFEFDVVYTSWLTRAIETALSSYSLSYPGNDYKRTKYVKDLRISLMETINRSIEAKKFQ